MTWAMLCAGAYLLGSIPFGVLIARAKGIDIRAHGSGNIGATNVGRIVGMRWGIACFVLDMGKGAVPVVIAAGMHGMLSHWALDLPAMSSWLLLGVAASAFVGHMYSVFLRFSGGKGVATAFGALLAAWPMTGVPALGALLVWIAMMLLTRTVSLASMTAAVALPVIAGLTTFLGPAPADLAGPEAIARAMPVMALTVGVAVLVLWRHRENIRRLIAGSEHRVGG